MDAWSSTTKSRPAPPLLLPVDAVCPIMLSKCSPIFVTYVPRLVNSLWPNPLGTFFHRQQLCHCTAHASPTHKQANPASLTCPDSGSPRSKACQYRLESWEKGRPRISEEIRGARSSSIAESGRGHHESVMSGSPEGTFRISRAWKPLQRLLQFGLPRYRDGRWPGCLRNS